VSRVYDKVSWANHLLEGEQHAVGLPEVEPQNFQAFFFEESGYAVSEVA
jgi:hypothetical protein